MPILLHRLLYKLIQHPRQSASHSSGFTLIEVMVVIVIMAVLVGLVSISSRPDPERALRQEAERLAQHLLLAQQESVLRATPIAWIANGTHYRFIMRHNGQWQYLDQLDQALSSNRGSSSTLSANTSADPLFAPHAWQTPLSDIRVTGLMLPNDVMQRGVLAGNTASLLIGQEPIDQPATIILKHDTAIVQLQLDGAAGYAVQTLPIVTPTQ